MALRSPLSLLHSLVSIAACCSRLARLPHTQWLRDACQPHLYLVVLLHGLLSVTSLMPMSLFSGTTSVVSHAQLIRCPIDFLRTSRSVEIGRGLRFRSLSQHMGSGIITL